MGRSEDHRVGIVGGRWCLEASDRHGECASERFDGSRCDMEPRYERYPRGFGRACTTGCMDGRRGLIYEKVVQLRADPEVLFSLFAISHVVCSPTHIGTYYSVAQPAVVIVLEIPSSDSEVYVVQSLDHVAITPPSYQHLLRVPDHRNTSRNRAQEYGSAPLNGYQYYPPETYRPPSLQGFVMSFRFACT